MSCPKCSLRVISLRAVLLAILALSPMLVSCVKAQKKPTPALDSLPISLALLASGLNKPVEIVDPNDGTGRQFVVEQRGTIRILKNSDLQPDPFLDITARASNANEQGLLSVAFHPEFRSNNTLFIFYTDPQGTLTVERWQVSANNPDLADPASAATILTIDHPESNHNGGLLLFGPDGYLYIGVGDGGSEGDPNGNGQKTTDLLGNILRIDVDHSSGATPYSIPADNPFANKGNASPEIWLYGLRNPWRFSFDSKSGDLFIGDVGQDQFEEINLFPKDGSGRNFGWSVMEGTGCYDASECDSSGLELPIFSYSHAETGGCSVVGGYVYHGTEIPALEGAYLFADYCSGAIWGLTKSSDGKWTATVPLPSNLRVSSFGEDSSGELYVIDLDGSIYRVVAAQ